MRSRRSTESWSWINFRDQFEHQSIHRKVKEQELLALVQGDMSMLNYEIKFYDLSMFASYYVPSE